LVWLGAVGEQDERLRVASAASGRAAQRQRDRLIFIGRIMMVTTLEDKRKSFELFLLVGWLF